MKLFKESKHQPIKFRGFKFIGFHDNYPNICYYYKPMIRGNFELLECFLEGERKPEIGAGTNVKVLDPFMATYLDNRELDSEGVVSFTIANYFYDLDDNAKKEMHDKYTAKVPKEIKTSALFRKYKDAGYDILYCSNDESKERLFGIVNIMLVKEEHIVSEKVGINSYYTLFKPLRFSVSPRFLKGEATKKYIEMELNEIQVNHNILND